MCVYVSKNDLHTTCFCVFIIHMPLSPINTCTVLSQSCYASQHNTILLSSRSFLGHMSANTSSSNTHTHAICSHSTENGAQSCKIKFVTANPQRISKIHLVVIHFSHWIHHSYGAQPTFLYEKCYPSGTDPQLILRSLWY